jgi:hypothetical protein
MLLPNVDLFALKLALALPLPSSHLDIEEMAKAMIELSCMRNN